MTVPVYNLCTIWSTGEKDPITGLTTPGTVRVYKTEVARGGKTKLSDNKGVEFYPSTTFWPRSNEIVYGTHTEPTTDEMIAEGDHRDVADPSTVGAEIIRGVMVHNNAAFGEADTYTLGTSA